MAGLKGVLSADRIRTALECVAFVVVVVFARNGLDSPIGRNVSDTLGISIPEPSSFKSVRVTL